MINNSNPNITNFIDMQLLLTLFLHFDDNPVIPITVIIKLSIINNGVNILVSINLAFFDVTVSRNSKQPMDLSYDLLFFYYDKMMMMMIMIMMMMIMMMTMMMIILMMMMITR